MPMPEVNLKTRFLHPRLRTQIGVLKAHAQKSLDSLSSLQAERDALETERDALETERDALKAERDALKAENKKLQNKYTRLKWSTNTADGESTVSVHPDAPMEQDLSGFDIPKPTDDDGMVLKTDQPADDDEMMVAGGGPGPDAFKTDQSREEIASEAGTPKNEDDE